MLLQTLGVKGSPDRVVATLVFDASRVAFLWWLVLRPLRYLPSFVDGIIITILL